MKQLAAILNHLKSEGEMHVWGNNSFISFHFSSLLPVFICILTNLIFFTTALIYFILFKNTTSSFSYIPILTLSLYLPIFLYPSLSLSLFLALFFLLLFSCPLCPSFSLSVYLHLSLSNLSFLSSSLSHTHTFSVYLSNSLSSFLYSSMTLTLFL